MRDCLCKSFVQHLSPGLDRQPGQVHLMPPPRGPPKALGLGFGRRGSGPSSPNHQPRGPGESGLQPRASLPPSVKGKGHSEE